MQRITMAESRRRVFATPQRILTHLTLATTVAVLSIVFRHSVWPLVGAGAFVLGCYLWTCTLPRSSDNGHGC